MITCEIKLLSAITDQEETLGLLVIDNISTTPSGNHADYRCRMYRKGTKLVKSIGRGWSFIGGRKPKAIRQAIVHNHARRHEPIQNLVAKALKALEYG